MELKSRYIAQVGLMSGLNRRIGLARGLAMLRPTNLAGSTFPEAASKRSIGFYALVGYLFLVMLLGGGSRGDILSLIVLRPMAVLVSAFALISLKRENVSQFRILFILTGLCFLLAGAHLVPLAPAVWEHLPGRNLIVSIDVAARHEGTWRPLSMVPRGARNAFFSLFVPLGVLLWAIQLDADELRKTIPFVVVLGALTAILGIAQVAGGPLGPLYFYRITNKGAAVGFFSNRNHQAVFLAALFPMLAWVAAMRVRPPRIVAVRAAILGVCGMLIPVLLATGSRLGLVTGLLGALGSYWIYVRPARVEARARRVSNAVLTGIVLISVAALGALTVAFSRAEALSRLLSSGVDEDVRTRVWVPILDSAIRFLPWGSGNGSFPEVYQISERPDLLSYSYLNHAHNDYLEVLYTLGLPGVLLLLLAVAAWLFGAIKLAGADSRVEAVRSGRVGVVVLALLGVGSITDYPLRTPFLACIGVLSAVWVCRGLASADRRQTG